MSNRTRTWFVNGIVTSFQKGMPRMMKKKFCVRYTSDKIGKSLSIADEASGVMFQIPFDELYKQILESGNDNV